MTLLSLNNFYLSVIFIISLLLLTVSIEVAVERSDIKIKSYSFLYSLLLSLASLLPAQTLAEIGSGKIFIAKIFLNSSIYGFIFYILCVFFLEIFFIKKILNDRKKQIGKNSIKESLDNLPDGICFSKLDGTPLLVNRKMQEISYQVFGERLVNDLACEKAVREKKIKAQANILQDNPLIIESDNKIWLIEIVYHNLVRETLAYDISLEWDLLEKIKNKNMEIKASNLRLKDYQKNVSQYTRQKEILQAKINIHDKIGQSLIYFKHYLEKPNKNKEDRNKLIQLWQESLLILKEKKDSTSTKSSWEKLISTAKAIDVEIHLKGQLPKSEGDLNILVGIVHEALNNAIRHGEAKNVWINLEEDDSKVYCQIINDGKAPQLPLEEKGGLKNIRQRLKIYNGEMKIYTDPNFKLDLSWLKGENYDL